MPGQYRSLAFTEALNEAGIAGSIGSVGDALDCADGVGHRPYKTELIDRQHSWTDRYEVERETAARVHWFNTERLHSTIGYRPPVEFEKNTTVTPLPSRSSRWPEPRLRQIQDSSDRSAVRVPRH